MRVYPDGYLDKITEFGRQIESEITYTVDEETTTLTVEDINKIQVIYNADFFRTIMTRVDVETKVHIPKNTIINIKFGVKIDEEYPKVDFGNYKIIEEPVFNADSKSYTFMAYDEMVDSMIGYDDNTVDIEFPTTHKEFIDAISTKLGWSFSEETYTNSETLIEKDIYVGTDMTVRGVLDDLCVATMGNFVVKDKELKLKYPADTGLILEDKYLKDVKVEFGKHFGPVNSLVLSRSAESDNIYNQDQSSIEEHGINEIKIVDNVLLSGENRNNWIQAMFNRIKGFEFDLFDITTTGVGIFEPLDKLTISHDNKEYSVIVMNNEFTITQGLEETMFTEEPEFSETDYKYADTEDRVFRKAQIIVDKQNLEINSLVEKTDELESQVTEVTQTTDGLTATVAENITDLQEKIAELGLTQDELELIFKLQNGNNLIRNSVMKNGTSFWYKELYDVFASSVKPENPYDGQYWFNEEDSEEYKRNQLYQWNKADNRWIESTKSKYDLMNTGVEGFTQFEHQESRENSISNSIILMDAGNNILEKTHLFGITEGISIPTDTEIISLGLKVKNQIRTGNIYVNFGFAPVEPGDMVSGDEEGYLLYGIKEDWHKITPDDNTSWSKIERHLKVPKKEDLKLGHKGTTAPEDIALIWLDEGNKSYGKFPIAKYYNEETESWELCEDCPTILIDNRIYTYREFYSGYYKTMYTEDDFKANYLFVALTCYPSANYETGPELPETATDRDSYFGILGSADTSHDKIYRARFRDGEFESWVSTDIPSLLPLNPELQAMIPSPPFPTNTIIPVSGQFYFTDLKAESGMLCTAWSPHIEETYTTSYKSDSSGQKIISGENTMLMSDEEILATKGTEEVFRISGDLTKFKYIESLKAKLSGLNIQKTKIGNTDTIIMF